MIMPPCTDEDEERSKAVIINQGYLPIPLEISNSKRMCPNLHYRTFTCRPSFSQILRTGVCVADPVATLFVIQLQTILFAQTETPSPSNSSTPHSLTHPLASHANAPTHHKPLGYFQSAHTSKANGWMAWVVADMNEFIHMWKMKIPRIMVME